MHDRARQRLDSARRRSESALVRALTALERAERAERDAAVATGRQRERSAAVGRFWRDAADTHFAASRVHAASADLIGMHLEALRGSRSLVDALSSVGRVIGAESVAVTLLTGAGQVAAVLATDARSRAAQGLEVVLGQGPANEAAASVSRVQASVDQMRRRWPEFAAGAAEIGVETAAAVPLGRAVALGVMAVYDPVWSPQEEGMDCLEALGDTFVDPVLDDLLTEDGEETFRRVLSQDALVPLLHGAAGVVAVTAGCSTNDALALIRARAFADGADLREVSQRVLDGSLRLSP